MTNSSIPATKHRHVWTPVEFGLVVFFLGMLLAMIAPRFLNAESKEKNDKVLVNMHIAQIAVESYAADHGNMYPAAIDDALKSYYPGGNADGLTPASQGTMNPYSKRPEFPVLGTLIATPTAVRTNEPAPTGGEPGQIVYIPLDNNHTYAMLGTAGSGRALPGILPKTALVYSNLW